jgi:hypothetical protein
MKSTRDRVTIVSPPEFAAQRQSSLADKAHCCRTSGNIRRVCRTASERGSSSPCSSYTLTLLFITISFDGLLWRMWFGEPPAARFVEKGEKP